MGVDVTHVAFPLVEGVIDGRGFQGEEGVYTGIQRVRIDMELTAADMTQEQVRRVEATPQPTLRPCAFSPGADGKRDPCHSPVPASSPRSSTAWASSAPSPPP